MHALADTGVPNRICPQKESLASTVDCPTGPNPVDFLLFFPTMPCFTKVKNGQKQWGCREWMAVPIFPVPAIRKPWLPPSAAYRKLVYRFFPSFPSQNASLAWLGFPLLLCSVLWAELIWLFKVFCKWAELYLSLSLWVCCVEQQIQVHQTQAQPGMCTGEAQSNMWYVSGTPLMNAFQVYAWSLA